MTNKEALSYGTNVSLILQSIIGQHSFFSHIQCLQHVHCEYFPSYNSTGIGDIIFSTGIHEWHPSSFTYLVTMTMTTALPKQYNFFLIKKIFFLLIRITITGIYIFQKQGFFRQIKKKDFTTNQHAQFNVQKASFIIHAS